MKQTTPLLVTVTVLCAALLALVMFWLAVLPGQLASALTREIENRTGLNAKVSGSSLGLQGGLSLQLDNVTLTGTDTQSVPTATVEHIRANLSLGSIFGGKLRLENIDLESPVINIKTDGTTSSEVVYDSGVAASPDTERQPKGLSVKLHNGTVKWSDAAKQVSFAVTDLNGGVSTDPDGGAKIDLAGLLNGKLTRLAGTIDDTKRLKADGSPSDLNFSSGQNSISFSGRTRMRNGVQMDGRLAASSNSLRELAGWFGLQFSGFSESGAVNAETSVSWDGQHLDLKQLAITLGQSKISGGATLDVTQVRPMLNASLQADQLDLSVHSKAAGIDQPSTATAIAKPWKESNMDFRDLRVLDAKLKLSTDKLIVAGLATGKATMNVDLNDGALAMTLASDNVAGGKANAELKVSKGGEMPELALKLETQDVGAHAFLQPLLGFAVLDGKLSLQTDLTSQGDSIARLISSLSGTTELALKDGNINGLELARFLAGKGKGWRLKSDATTVVTSGEAKFELQDGIAQISAMSVESSGLKLSAEGEIDLLRQNLDLICKPEIAGSVKLPVRLAVSGPWTDPAVDTDIDPAKLKPKALLKTGKRVIKKLFGN